MAAAVLPSPASSLKAGKNGLVSLAVLKTFSKNSVVQIVEQAINVVLGMAVAIYLARELGHSAFGIFMLCQALIRMAMTVLGFGLDVVILREASSGSSDSRFISSAITIYAFNMAIILSLGAVVALVVPIQDTTTLFTLLAMAPGLLLVPFEALEFWFRARQDALSPAIARSIAVIVGSGLKIVLVATGAGLVLLGWAHALQVSLVGFLLFMLYRRHHSLVLNKAVFAEILRLYKDAWPLFVTTLCYMILMRIDVLMLTWFHGNHEAGLYSAAIRISEVANVAPVIIVTAASPIIFRAAKHNVKEFHKVFGMFLNAFNILFLVGAIGVAILSPYIIAILFGQQFNSSATMLTIHIFSVLFVWQGVATQLWWIKRRRPKVIMWRSFAGAIANVLLNLLLIPHYGGVGAAVASVVAQAIIAVGINPFLGRNGWLLLRIQMTPRLPIALVPKLFSLRRPPATAPENI